MTELLLMPPRSSVAGWLRQLDPDVCALGDRRWQLNLADGVTLRISASVDDPFLLFEAPAPVTCELERAPQWLQWNAALSGNAKFALMPKPWRLRLRTEVPVDDDANIAVRIAESVTGLREACELLRSGTTPAHPTSPTFSMPNADTASHGLFALLREMGWSFQERASGAATVELAMRTEACRVLLEESPAGIRAGIELVQVNSITLSSRLAIAAMLLSAAGSVRFARPYATQADDQFVCGYEVKFAGGCTSGELEHALEALAVACWACKLEVQSLLDNSVAESYLAIRNPSPTLAKEEF